MTTAHELRHAGYLITDDRSRLDAEVIHRYLSQESYWAKGVSREIVNRSLENALCIGVYAPSGQQVGLARVITDFATYAYLCDVFILNEHRGKGVGKALIQAVVSHPRLQTIRRMTLGTLDAHGLYAPFGFKAIGQPERHMEKRYPANNPSDAC
ncbi:MAG TPA: GNAT family N-acetyltransferase [Opitutus sp.]|nr:GNAT family N-acetyltransferase [Opitutus sp.]